MSTPAEIFARYAIRTTETFPNIGVYSLNATGTNTLIATLTGLTYFNKLKMNVLIENNNTGTVTLNMNSLGAKTIYKVIDNVKTVLAAKDLRKGGIAQLEYDGTDFILLSNGYKEVVKVALPFVGDIGAMFSQPVVIFVAPEDLSIIKVTMIKQGDFAGVDGSNTFQTAIYKGNNVDIIAVKTFTTNPTEVEVLPIYSQSNTNVLIGEKVYVANTFTGTSNPPSLMYQIEYV